MHHDGVAASDLEQLDKRLEELRKLLDYPFGKPEQSKDLQDLDELVIKIVSEVSTIATNSN